MTKTDRLAMLEAIHNGLEWRGRGAHAVTNVSPMFGTHVRSMSVRSCGYYLAAFSHRPVLNPAPGPTLIGFMFLYSSIDRSPLLRKTLSALLQEFAPSVKLTEDANNWFINNELWPVNTSGLVVFDAAVNDETVRAAVLAAHNTVSDREFPCRIFSPLSTRAWIPLGPMTMAEIGAGGVLLNDSN